LILGEAPFPDLIDPASNLTDIENSVMGTGFRAMYLCFLSSTINVTYKTSLIIMFRDTYTIIYIPVRYVRGGTASNAASSSGSSSM
jgi:hypothetical protein